MCVVFVDSSAVILKNLGLRNELWGYAMYISSPATYEIQPYYIIL